MQFEWQESLVLGVEQLDLAHKDLFDKMKILAADCAKDPRCTLKLVGALSSVIWFAKTHIRDEEALMLRCAYPDRERHFKDHSIFLNFLDHQAELLEVYPETLNSADFLMEFERWQRAHLMTHDKSFADFLKGMANLL